MAFMLNDITNQKTVKVQLGDGDRDVVMLGIKYRLLPDDQWGELIDSLTPPPVDKDDPNATRIQYADTLKRHKHAVVDICEEVSIQSESGLQINLLVSELDSDGNPLRNELGKRVTKRVVANLKKGDMLEGEVWDAFISVMAVVQQIFDYYSKHVQNVHQRDKDKKK